jgi:hypothetical protein
MIITPIIEQTQLMLLNLLGDRFYFDLINNLDNEKYQPLDGCAFTYFGISYARWY